SSRSLWGRAELFFLYLSFPSCTHPQPTRYPPPAPRTASAAPNPRGVKPRPRQRRSSQSRCSPTSFFGRCPPIWPGAKLPVRRYRLTQSIAVLIATSKRAAAWLQDRPPRSTASTTRCRRSIEYAFAIHAGLLPSQQVESDHAPLGNPLSIPPKLIPL